MTHPGIGNIIAKQVFSQTHKLFSAESFVNHTLSNVKEIRLTILEMRQEQPGFFHLPYINPGDPHISVNQSNRQLLDNFLRQGGFGAK